MLLLLQLLGLWSWQWMKQWNRLSLGCFLTKAVTATPMTTNTTTIATSNPATLLLLVHLLSLCSLQWMRRWNRVTLDCSLTKARSAAPGRVSLSRTRFTMSLWRDPCSVLRNAPSEIPSMPSSNRDRRFEPRFLITEVFWNYLSGTLCWRR